MSTEPGESRSRLGKRLSRKKPVRLPSLQYPQHLQPGDDVDEDVTAPKGQAPQIMHLNQSMLSLITATGAKKDFHSQFDDDNSGSDTEREESGSPSTELSAPDGTGSKATGDEAEHGHPKAKDKAEDGKPSHSKLRLSLPKLKVRSKKEKHYMSHSTILPSREDGRATSLAAANPRDAPYMSRMLEAQTQQSPEPLSPGTEEALKELSISDKSSDSEPKKGSASLKMRLKEIFGFDEEEEVISEYPVWLLQSVLLQGYLYVTAKHIAFYAYLPKKAATVVKSGYLAKRGKKNPKFTRYWCTLKGDVLSYYTDPSQTYFPSGYIDLRYAISAAVADTSKDKSKETHFTVSTHQRNYIFKGDSPSSTKEWVKILQKVIFRSHNDGDSVKISLPIQNVIDVEESPVLDFADTVKIRVVDSDETYAIDEYFFSFFSFGKDAINVLRSLVEGTSASKIPPDLLHQHGAHHTPGTGNSPTRPFLRETVRATLSPGVPSPGALSPRASGEWARPSFDAVRAKSTDAVARSSGEWGRRSIDVARSHAAHPGPAFEERGRRTASASRTDKLTKDKETGQSTPTKLHDSSESPNTQSLEPSSTSSGFNVPSDPSASQILTRSDVFRSPTIHRLADSPDRATPPHRSETDQTGSSHEHVHVHPPSRSQTQPQGRLEEQEQEEEAPSLQTLVKGSFPLAKAAGFAGYLRRGSKRMSSLLATESMGYVEKVSGMWAGGRKHYGEGQTRDSTEPEGEELEDEELSGHGDRFRAHFALPETEKLQATYFGYLHRVLPLYGKIYIGDRHFCFRSLLPGTKTRLILPLADIENVHKERAFTAIRRAGLVIVIQAFEELFFEFSQTEVRDDCAITLLQSLESIKFLRDSGILSKEEKEHVRLAKEENEKLQQARVEEQNETELKLPTSISDSAHPGETPPILFDDPRASIINFKPTESLRITCLTIGSRGDVQPYIALCKGLLAEGHKPKIATHREFEPWIRKHGIDFAPVEGDPAELMRICVENGMFTYSFLKEASSKFRGWIDELLSSAWIACQNTDVLIESPSAMAGIHIAEALGIPYFRAFTMPWTRTRAYPHAFVVPERKMGGAYNYVTYVMFDNVFWAAISGQVNRWRKKELGLRSTNLDKQHPNKVPFLYNFSPSVVIPPLDFSDWIKVTGYWFLDEGSDWTPPEDMTNFIAKARKDGKKLVYIGFGSIVVSDPAALTKTVVDSVLKADVRAILSKGWSDRLGAKDSSKPEVPLPPEILQIKSAPHDWLFKQIDAAVHHGGAGTTGASLRAGLPTIIKPFFGDQFFFGGRVEDLGVGICMRKMNCSVFSRALWEATNSERMIVKARILGEQIRSEDGVGTAIQAIYRDLEYAKTLIKGKRQKSEHEHEPVEEESWTFIGDESDPELIRRIAEWEPPVRGASIALEHGHGTGNAGAHAARKGFEESSNELEKGKHHQKDNSSKPHCSPTEQVHRLLSKSGKDKEKQKEKEKDKHRDEDKNEDEGKDKNKPVVADSAAAAVAPASTVADSADTPDGGK